MEKCCNWMEKCCIENACKKVFILIVLMAEKNGLWYTIQVSYKYLLKCRR